MNPYYIPDTPHFVFNGRRYAISSAMHRLVVLYGHHLVSEALDSTFTTPQDCSLSELEKYCEIEESKYF